MADQRTRFWHPVEDVSAYQPRTVVYILHRGYHEVLVCGLHEVLVRRLTFWEVAERVWGGRARRWVRSVWLFGRR